MKKIQLWSQFLLKTLNSFSNAHIRSHEKMKRHQDVKRRQRRMNIIERNEQTNKRKIPDVKREKYDGC